MTYYVYILFSPSLKKYYIGETEGLHTRLSQHNNGFFSRSFTKKAQEWTIFHSIKCENRILARKIETHIKNMKSRKYIENLKHYPEIELKLKAKYR